MVTAFVLSLPTQGVDEYTCLINSLSFSETIDDAETASFDVVDVTANLLYERQEVEIKDTQNGLLLFSGFIERITDQTLPGHLDILMRSITCTGNRYRAEKRLWTGQEFNGWRAGDALVKMHHDVLAQEGVLASYAMRYDHDAATFGQGTLSGTVVEGDTLTLAPSGTDFTQTETTTANFNSGTLSGVIGVNGALALVSSLAIKYSGTAGANLENNNLYAFRKIWGGSYTLVSQDRIYVDEWISSSSPQIMAGIDMQFADGSWMHNYPTNFQDQWVIPLDPKTDLAGHADDQWMKRYSIVPSEVAGKTVVAIYLTLEGQNGGDYTTYFKNIKITNSTGGTTRVSVFSGADTTMKANVPAGSSGYFNLKASVVTVYEHDGSRQAPARSITNVGIVSGSVISWVEQDTDQGTTGKSTNYAPQVQVMASVDDGASWQTCTNHAPLPGLLVGMNTSGRTITLQQQLSVGGPNPELTPMLNSCSFTVFTAAACTKTDYVDIDNSQATLATGVLSNCTAYADGVKSSGYYKDWDDQTTGAITMFGIGVTPTYGVQTGYFFNRADSSVEVRARLDDAGTKQNFISEVDIQIVTDSGQYGLEYRTNSFVSGAHRYAYVVQLDKTQIILSRGSNGGGDAHTDLVTVPLTLTVGAWYRVKLAITGSTHKVFLNDVLLITATDATYSSGGNFLLWAWDNAVGRQSGHYDNFGVVGYEADFLSVSSRTTPALSLGGIVGNSRINWQAIEPSSSILLVERTLDGEVTWATCTNGEQIPSLVPGYNAAGKSIKFRFSMTNQAINVPVVLQGFSAFIIGQYNASGTFITPALDLAPAVLVGSSALTWEADTPAGTGVVPSTSLDRSLYTPVPTSGSEIPGLVTSGALVADDFDTNTASNFTATFWAGGTSPVFTVDTVHSRMVVSSGTNGMLVWTPLGTAKNVSLEVVSDQCESGGFILRYVDVNNLYYVTFRDGAASSNSNTVAIRKRVAGVDTQLAAPSALPGTWTRGTFHSLKGTMIDNQITIFFDGIQAAQISDSSITAAGWVGLRHSSSVSSQWQSIRGERLGDDAAGTLVSTKLVLSSSDPAQKPVVSELVASVRGPDIMTGAILDTTQYAYKSISANIADAAGRSNMYWRIDKTLHLSMKNRAYSPAPWPLSSSDPLFRGTNNPPRLERSSPSYRNRQYVTGAIDLQTITESKKADGTAQSWALSYPVETLVSVILNGNEAQSIGIQGTDTGRQFYYQQGQSELSTDSTLFIEAGTIISVSYVGRVPYTAMKESAEQQTLLAARDHTTGIVEQSEDCGGLSAASADAIAQARIDEFAILAASWTYSTSRPGLLPGHFQSVFVPEFSMNDLDVLITSIHTTPWQDGDGNLHYTYDISTTSGPNLGVWQRVFALAAK